MAIALRDLGIATRTIGVDANESHAKKAVELDIVDEMADLKTAIGKSSLIIVAIPVHAAEKILPGIMDLITSKGGHGCKFY